MALISEEKIRDIRNRTDIVSVIGQFVPLRRAGTSLIGLCPFHGEKTPSFHVNPLKQFFYCFGCQKSGDVFRFLMDHQSRTFFDVLEDLARRAGVEIQEESSPFGAKDSSRKRVDRSEKELLLQIHEQSCLFFEGQLKKNPEAFSYVQSRGIFDEVSQQFRLGYAPASWDSLLQWLKKQGFSSDVLGRSGLFVSKEQDRFYDRFRDRIIFPLMGISGEVLGFGGRSLPSKKESDPSISAKYINSPESILYKKGESLYGLSIAKEFIQKSKQAILVEGNFDVLSLHQRGIKNTVAPMGTALTKMQIQLLKRVLGEDGSVILMLDGDRAGQKATLKDIFLFSDEELQEMAILTEQEVDVKVVQLPDGEDPDTYIARDLDGFRRRLSSAKPALDYVLERAIEKGMTGGIDGKAKLISQMLPLLRAIRNPAALEMSIAKLASNLAISPAIISKQLRSQAPSGLVPFRSVSSAPEKPRMAGSKITTFHPIVRNLLSLCGDHPYIIGLLEEDTLNRLDHSVIAEMLREARYRIQQGLPVVATDLIDLAPMEIRNAVASAVFAGIFTKVEDPKRALHGIYETLMRHHLQSELVELKHKLAAASKEGDQSLVSELALRIRELMQDHASMVDGRKEKE